MRLRVLALCALICGCIVFAQTQAVPPVGPGSGGARGASGRGGGRYVDPLPYNFSDHEGWLSMFDGATLKNWDGPPDVWRVENGSIVAESTAANPLPSVYLYWTGGPDRGQLKNFDFKTEIKLEGEGANSGVQFRALRLGPSTGKYSQWESRGYQADYDYVNGQTGALIECCAGPRRGVPPRPFKASMGQAVRAALSDTDKPEIIGRTEDPDVLKKSVHTGDWNEMHIVARGTTLMYFLNGHLMSVFLDDNPKMFVDHGELAIQLEGRGVTKVSYRNLWVKILP